MYCRCYLSHVLLFGTACQGNKKKGVENVNVTLFE